MTHSAATPQAMGTTITINAVEVKEVVSLLEDRNGEFTELEGIITSFRSATDFDVNGEPVSTESNAEVTGTPALSSWVEIEGTVDADTLAASTVRVKTVEEQGEVWILDTLADLITGKNNFTLRDGDVTVEWNDDTVFDAASLPKAVVV